MITGVRVRDSTVELSPTGPDRRAPLIPFKYRRTYESQQMVITATAGHVDHQPVRRIGDDDRCVTLGGPKSEPVESSRVGTRLPQGILNLQKCLLKVLKVGVLA